MAQPFAKLTPRIVRAFFLAALRFYFRDHPDYPWNQDPAKTKIMLQDEFAETKIANIFPSVILETTGEAYTSLGIGNYANLELGWMTPNMNVIFQYQADGALNFHCISDSTIESEELGFEVCTLLMGAAQAGADMLQMQHISAPSATKPQRYQHEGWPITYDTVVSIRYTFTRSAKYYPMPDGPLLNEIDIILGEGDVIAPEDGNDGFANVILTVSETDVTGDQSGLGEWGCPLTAKAAVARAQMMRPRITIQ